MFYVLYIYLSPLISDAFGFQVRFCQTSISMQELQNVVLEVTESLPILWEHWHSSFVDRRTNMVHPKPLKSTVNHRGRQRCDKHFFDLLILASLLACPFVHSISVWIRRGELPTMQTELLHCVYTTCPSWDLRRCRAAENGSAAPGDDQEGKLEAMPSLSTFVWKRKWMQFHDLPIWTVQLWQGRMDVVITAVICCVFFASHIFQLLCSFYSMALLLHASTGSMDLWWFVWSRVFAESFLVFKSWAQRGLLEPLQNICKTTDLLHINSWHKCFHQWLLDP